MEQIIMNNDNYEELIFNIQKFKNIKDEGIMGNYLEDEIEKLERKIIRFREKNTEKQDSSSQYREALISTINQVNYYMVNPDIRSYKSILETIKSYNSEFNRIEILEKLAETKNNIVIIGANGAGKSSFVSSLQQSLISNMIVIPAQKSLFYYPDASNQMLYSKSIKDVESYQSKDFITFSKGEFSGYQLQGEYLENFSVLITALANDYIHHGMSIAEEDENALRKDEIIFNKLRTIWGILLPHIELKVDSRLRTIYPIVEGNRFNVNSLSDGEKCMFYYIGNILMAHSNSYIIVDEPETFLNPSIYNKLWDLLCDYRKDCQFIFCSHTVDFITSRLNSTLVWNKKFRFPSEWDIEFIPDTTSIPTSILAELLGSRKRVLFCEGDDKNSIDFKIYSGIFLENYTVIPAGGHTKVIQYVKAFNELESLHNNKALGIIDGDLLTDEISQRYKKENIYTLPFNEIEMLLFTEEVMESYLEDIFGEIKAKENIKRFKEEFYKSITKNKEKIGISKIKKIIDSKLENYRIQNTNSLEELTTEYENLNTLINIQEEYLIIMTVIDTYVKEGCYKELLNLCNLKEEVSKGLANKFLDSNYVDKAIYKIRSNKTLNNIVKETYFNEILDPN
ncbi:hypothetical protein PMSD_18500 [Paenibacillus macquariensis subsp. defensor]|nr:hypothetical protein PMSD_18500 [Paenibacillus macquariensis subsp. defensor]